MVRNKIKAPTLLKKFIIFEIVLFLCLMGWYTHRVNEIQIHSMDDKLYDVYLSIDSSFSDAFSHAESIMEYIGGQIMAHDTEDLQHIYELLDGFDNQSQMKGLLTWSAIAWADDKDELKVDSSLGVLKAPYRSMSYRDFFNKCHEEPGKLHMGKPDLGAVSKVMVLPSGLGVMNGKGRYAGTLFTGFDISKFRKRITKSNQYGDIISFAIFDKEQNVLLESENQYVSKTQRDLINGFLKSGGDSIIKIPDLFFLGVGGNSYKIKQLSGHPYYIIVSVHNEFSSQSLMRTIQSSFLDLLVVFIIATIFVLFIRKYLVMPVVELSKAADDLSEGREDIYIKEYTSEELVALADALKKVIVQRHDLVDANQKLEFLFKKAEAANEAKSDFIRNMQHELRTPLNHIIGGSDVIASEYAGPIMKEYKEYINIINQSGKDLLEIVNNIIAIADFEAGKIELEEVTCSVNEIIDNALKVVLPKITSNDLDLKVQISSRLPKLFVDPKQFEKAIGCLLNNAITFNKKKGKIRIKASEKKGEVIIEVSDTGIGIEKADLKRITGSFEYSGEILKKVHKGIGLGLSIVQSIMELHGAKFSLESKEGKGTTVQIIIPQTRLRKAARK